MTATRSLEPTPDAGRAYDVLAPAYDRLTAGYCHEAWLAAILELAHRHGLRGRRALDVACGTGKSFLPLLDGGFQVTACDVSTQMVAIARTKAPTVDVLVQDMRRLDDLGEFDLVTCLDDALNYLVTIEDLDAFFAGVARVLAPAGVCIFDVNSLSLYRTEFGRDWTLDGSENFIAWRAAGAGDLPPSGRATATVTVFTREGELWKRVDSVHQQRHWPDEEIRGAAEASGLRVVAAYGQRRGAKVEPVFDEHEHHKRLYVVKHQERR